MRIHLRACAMLTGALLLAACRTTAPVAAPGTRVPADDNLNAVAWVQRSAEYTATTAGIYRAAGARLDALLAAGEDALPPDERANPAAGLPPAIIMDIDETVLDNSPYQARLVLQGTEFADAGWAQWVAQAQAKPVPGVVAFTRAAADKGIVIYYVSNREEGQRAETLANLRAAGLPVKDDGVFLGMGRQVDGCVSTGSDKHCRRVWVGRRHRVLMQIGDQLGDFASIPRNTPQARAELSARYADWWGERWWMLPNPTYGSWEPALFGNDWKQSRDERRQVKRASLLPMYK